MNSNLDLALEVLQPIKVFFSFADQAYYGDNEISNHNSIFFRAKSVANKISV